MLERLLSHKKYEDNGLVYNFVNIRHEKNSIRADIQVEVPKDRGWNQYMLEFFAYNIINEKIFKWNFF